VLITARQTAGRSATGKLKCSATSCIILAARP
jgi:hypothetical protein